MTSRFSSQRDWRARAATLAVLAAALGVACCVPAPAVLVALADLTLAAAGGLALGAVIVVGICVVRSPARTRPRPRA